MAAPGRNQGLSGNGTIAILGAGSMGQLWAGYLPTGTVTFVPRREVTPETGKSALSYTFQPFEGPEVVVTVPYLLATEARPPLLMVTTKAGDTLQPPLCFSGHPHCPVPERYGLPASSRRTLATTTDPCRQHHGRGKPPNTRLYGSRRQRRNLGWSINRECDDASEASRNGAWHQWINGSRGARHS